jgi:hypothetical protein
MSAVAEEGKKLILSKTDRGGVVVKAFASIEWHGRTVVVCESDGKSLGSTKKKLFASAELAHEFAQAFADACQRKGMRPPAPLPPSLAPTAATPKLAPRPRAAPFRGKKPNFLGYVSGLTSYVSLRLVDGAMLPDLRPRAGLEVSLSSKVGGVGVVYAFRHGTSIVLVEGPNRNEARSPDVLRFVVSDPAAKAKQLGEVAIDGAVLAVVTGNEDDDERERLARRVRSLRADRVASLDTAAGTRSLLVGLRPGRYRLLVDTTKNESGGTFARAVLTVVGR